MKIEQYLNSIKPKEVIYLFTSIPIVIFIIYSNFIYPSLVKTNKKLNAEIEKNKKELVKTVTEIRQIRKINKNLPIVEKKLEKLKEDFKYIKYNLDYLNLIKLNEDNVYKTLEKILNKANEFHLNTSFYINWDTTYQPYEKDLMIKIEGKGLFKNLINYIKYLESLNKIITINTLNISLSDSKNSKQDFIQQTLVLPNISFRINEDNNTNFLTRLNNLAQEFNILINKVKEKDTTIITLSSNSRYQLTRMYNILLKNNPSLNVKLNLNPKQKFILPTFTINLNLMGIK